MAEIDIGERSLKSLVREVIRESVGPSLREILDICDEAPYDEDTIGDIRTIVEAIIDEAKP